MPYQSQRRSCSRGHPLSGNNAYIRPNGRRDCRICNAERQRRDGNGGPCSDCNERPAKLRGRCQRCYLRAYRAGLFEGTTQVQNGGRHPDARLSVRPLVAYVRHKALVIEEWPDGHQSDFYRAQKEGRISFFAADRICCHLGFHPASVFGEKWWDHQAMKEEVAA